MSSKLASGGILPDYVLPLVDGGRATLGKPVKPGNWQIVFVYRGLHCPVCKEYLTRLETVEWIRENDYPVRGTYA